MNRQKKKNAKITRRHFIKVTGTIVLAAGTGYHLSASDEILPSDATWEVPVVTLESSVLVRNPTPADRRIAQKHASDHPAYNQLTSVDRDTLVLKMLALEMLVEPKITYEQYMSIDDTKVNIILGAIINEHTIKSAKLSEQSRENVRRFLEQLMGSDLESTLASLDSLTTTSKEELESGKE